MKYLLKNVYLLYVCVCAKSNDNLVHPYFRTKTKKMSISIIVYGSTCVPRTSRKKGTKVFIRADSHG